MRAASDSLESGWGVAGGSDGLAGWDVAGGVIGLAGTISGAGVSGSAVFSVSES
jgi:hypothetical protein